MEEEGEPQQTGIQINLVSREMLMDMDPAGRIRFIVDEIKKGKVLVLERGLTAEEEMELIKMTMSEIDQDSFIGVETPGFSVDLQRPTLFQRITRRVPPPRMMVVGPAHLLRTIRKDGKMVSTWLVTKDKFTPAADAGESIIKDTEELDEGFVPSADVEGSAESQPKEGPGTDGEDEAPVPVAPPSASITGQYQKGNQHPPPPSYSEDTRTVESPDMESPDMETLNTASPEENPGSVDSSRTNAADNNKPDNLPLPKPPKGFTMEWNDETSRNAGNGPRQTGNRSTPTSQVSDRENALVPGKNGTLVPGKNGKRMPATEGEQNPPSGNTSADSKLPPPGAPSNPVEGDNGFPTPPALDPENKVPKEKGFFKRFRKKEEV